MLKQATDYLPELDVHIYDAGHAFANHARSTGYVKDAAELAHERSELFMRTCLA